MTKIWVDPPSGYKFGFPKIYDKDENPDMNKWLVDNGYPQSIINNYPDGLPCITWDEKDSYSEYYQQVYYKY